MPQINRFKHPRFSIVPVMQCLVLLAVSASTTAADLQPLYENARQRPPNVVLILMDWARQDAFGVYS